MFEIGAGAVNAAQTAASAAGRAADASGWVWEHKGQLAGGTSIVLLGLLIWLSWKVLTSMFRTGAQAVPAVVKGYTGVDLTEVKRKPRETGEKAGRQLRVIRETRRGPTAGIHTGQTTEVLDRRNDSQGRPVRVVVCASTSFDAEALLSRRLGGHRWRYAGSRPCDLQPGRMNHHTYTNTKGAKR